MPAIDEISEKQEALYLADGRLSLAVGAAGSGKTWGAALGFADHVAGHDIPPPFVHLVTGRSPTELKNNVLPMLERRADELGCVHTWNDSERVLTIDGQTLMFIAWSNARSAGRIQGMNVDSCLFEEVVEVDEGYFDMVLSRMRGPYSRMIATCNPSYPTHWLKKRIDQGRIDDVTTFGLLDNPWLPDHYIDAMLGMDPSSVFYKRMVLGQWAAAEGLIYAGVKTSAFPPLGRVTRTFAGLDFGMTSKTALVRVEEYTHIAGAKSYFVTHAYEIAPEQGVSVMPAEQARRIGEFHERHPFEVVFVDPSAIAIESGLRAHGNFDVEEADNSVSPGIATVARMFAEGTLTIRLHADTEPLRDELAGYTWHPDKEDTPVKEDDHNADAFRYAMHSWCGVQRPAVW